MDEEMHSSYIKAAFSGGPLSTLTVVSTIIVFVSLLMQLYFDISKTASIKIALPLTLVATLFNIVAVVFGFITVGWSNRIMGILLFAILTSVCLIVTLVRAISLIAYKANNNI